MEVPQKQLLCVVFQIPRKSDSRWFLVLTMACLFLAACQKTSDTGSSSGEGRGGEVGNAPAGAPTGPAKGSSGVAFKTVAAGGFAMGGAGEKALPSHAVELAAFQISDAEVTFGEWKEVRDWALASGYDFANRGFGGGENEPVVRVNWYDVVKWCNARSEKCGAKPCYYTDAKHNSANVYRKGQRDLDAGMVDWMADGFRLPTEAEWEKAARGGKENQRFPGSDVLAPEDANYGGKGALEVRSFAPNGHGLFDMAGNVWEWCWDWHARETAGAEATTNPTGPAAGTRRVVRGGGWDDGPGACAVSFHQSAWPDYISGENRGQCSHSPIWRGTRKTLVHVGALGDANAI
jgi:formylglycine-generating enzyme required for sulfatase activity